MRKSADPLRVSDQSKRTLGFWALFLYALIPLISSAEHSASFRDVIPVLVVVLAAVFFSKEIHLWGTLILYLFLYLSALLSTLLSSYIGVQRTMITYLAFVCILILFSSLEFSAADIRSFRNMYVALGTLCAVLILLSWLFHKPYGWYRYSLDIIGLHKNPNYINNIILLAIAFCIDNLLKKDGRKLINVLLIVIMCFGCFLTGTRAALLCIVLLMLYAVGNLLFVKRKFVYLILLLTASAAGYLLLVTALPAYSMNRLVGDALLQDDGRIFMWTNALKEWSRQPILGMGIDGVSIYNQSHKLPALNIHNIYLQLLCDQGLVGFGLFAVILFLIVRRTRKQDRFLMTLMMIALFFPTFFQNGTVAHAFWWPLTLLEIFSKKSYRSGLQTA